MLQRQQLRDAIAAREIVRADLVNARTALSNAGCYVEQARTALAEYSGLDDEIAQARSHGLRVGVGGAAPMLSPLSSELQAKVDLRTRALNDLSVAETVCAKLAKEAGDLEAALNEATAEAERKAGDVWSEAAGRLCKILNEKLDEVRFLHRRLSYMSRQLYRHQPPPPKGPGGVVFHSQVVRAPRMSAEVVALVNDSLIQGDARLSVKPGEREAEAAKIAALWRALCDGDADHVLDGMEGAS